MDHALHAAPLSHSFYLEQARACMSLARRERAPDRRAIYVRLARHWRAFADAWDVTIADAA